MMHNFISEDDIGRAFLQKLEVEPLSQAFGDSTTSRSIHEVEIKVMPFTPTIFS